jgi:hypothetical protein
LTEEKKQPIVTLSNIAGGAVPELFEHELQKVLANIADPNSDPSATREITLKFRFKPNTKNRGVGEIDILSASKLGGTTGAETEAYFIHTEGQYVMVEHNPQQVQMDFDADQVANIKANQPVAVEGGREETPE